MTSPAGAPTGIVVVPGDTVLALSWTAPASTGGAPITDYVINIDPVPFGGSPRGVGSPATSTVLSELDNGTTYLLTVAAVTSYGYGTPSAAVSGTPTAPTDPTLLPPDPPYALTVEAGDTQALLSWTAPTQPVDSYTGTTDDGAGGIVTQTVAGTYTEWLLGGLTNGTTYTITLIASNANGDSGPSAPVTVTPVLGAPPLLDPNVPPGPIDPALLPPAPYPAPEVDADTLPYPIPGVRQAPLPAPTGGGVARSKAGHVQGMWVEALSNGQILYLTPSRGGLWLTAFDAGYPVVQEITQTWPDRDGVLDYTDRYGPRNLAINLLAEPWRGYDKNGVLQPADAWAALVRNWSSLDNSLRLHFQFTGQLPVYCDVRTSNYTAPITFEELGRYTLPITWALTSPDGMLYQEVLAGDNEDPARPGWYIISIASFSGGTSGLNFAGGSVVAGGAGLHFDGGSVVSPTTGINFAGGSGFGGAPIMPVPADTVGTRRSAPIITISGGACTGPTVSVYGGPDGQTLRARLQFATTLVLSNTDTMLIDVAQRRVVRNPDAYGNGEPLYKYLVPTVDWANFTINPADGNGFAFAAATADPSTTASFSYRATSV